MARALTNMVKVKDLLGTDNPQHITFIIEYCKDWNAPRAAEVAGYGPEYGHELKKRPEIERAIAHVLSQRLEAADIDPEWVLMELVDNHRIARHQNKISASNTALAVIAKHALVDAFAADKVMQVSDAAVIARLQRGRDRLAKRGVELPSFIDPEPPEELSFL